MQLMEGDAFLDPGASASDVVQGFISVSATTLLCQRPPGTTAVGAGLETDNSALRDYVEEADPPGALEISSTSCKVPSAGGAGINTSTATLPGEMLVRNYSAVNSRKLVAGPRYLVVVVVPRCPEGERWCASLSACSTSGGVCLAAPGSAGAGISGAGAKSVAAMPPDTTPPRIRLLGNGSQGILPTGEAVMQDMVSSL
jgi:hypothetical protein